MNKKYNSFNLPQFGASKGLKKCAKACMDLETACPNENSDCRYWLDYEPDLNCVLITTLDNKNYSLRETADRLGISFVRVKQIEDKALKKISHLLKDEAIQNVSAGYSQGVITK